MDKSSVDHSLGSRCSAAKAFEIFERTAMHVSSRRDKGSGARIRASQAEHLMTSVDKFSDNCRTKEAGSTRNKNPHILFLLSNSSFIREGLSAHSTCAPSQNLCSNQSPFAA